MKPLEGLGSQVTYPDAPEPGIHGILYSSASTYFHSFRPLSYLAT